MTERVAGATVRREVTVRAPLERAFSVSTEGIATWWPHEETHNVGPTRADAIGAMGRANASVYSLAFWRMRPPLPRPVRLNFPSCC